MPTFETLQEAAQQAREFARSCSAAADGYCAIINGDAAVVSTTPPVYREIATVRGRVHGISDSSLPEADQLEAAGKLLDLCGQAARAAVGMATKLDERSAEVAQLKRELLDSAPAPNANLRKRISKIAPPAIMALGKARTAIRSLRTMLRDEQFFAIGILLAALREQLAEQLAMAERQAGTRKAAGDAPESIALRCDALMAALADDGGLKPEVEHDAVQYLDASPRALREQYSAMMEHRDQLRLLREFALRLHKLATSLTEPVPGAAQPSCESVFKEIDSLKKELAAETAHTAETEGSLTRAARQLRGLKNALAYARKLNLFRRINATVADHPWLVTGGTYAILTSLGLLYLALLGMRARLDLFDKLAIPDYLVAGFRVGILPLLAIAIPFGVFVQEQFRLAHEPPPTPGPEPTSPGSFEQLVDTPADAKYDVPTLRFGIAGLLGFAVLVLGAILRPEIDLGLGRTSFAIYSADGEPIRNLLPMFGNDSTRIYYKREEFSGSLFVPIRTIVLPRERVRCAESERFSWNGEPSPQSDVPLCKLRSPDKENVARDVAKIVAAQTRRMVKAWSDAQRLDLEQNVFYLGMLYGRADGPIAPAFMERFRRCAAKPATVPILFPFEFDSAAWPANGSPGSGEAGSDGQSDHVGRIRAMMGDGGGQVDVFIAGFASAKGSVSHNLRLAERRAERIYQLLEQEIHTGRMPKDRIRTVEVIPLGEEWATSLASGESNGYPADNPVARSVAVYVCAADQERDDRRSVSITPNADPLMGRSGG